MQYYDNVVEMIGNTPLVRLRNVAEGIQATVLAKVEYLNPGGSVKDRIALRMVEDAEAAGILRPGGTIVEPTSGNTGVGLALVAQLRGYKCVFVCPDKVSQDKQDVLRAYGAEVVVCPTAVAPEDPALVLQRLRPAGPGDPRRLEAQPVRQPGEPAFALRDHRPGAVEADRGTDHPLRRRGGHRWHHLRDRAVPEGGVRRHASRSSARIRRARSTPVAPAGRTWSRGSVRTSGRRRTTGVWPTRSSRSRTRSPST